MMSSPGGKMQEFSLDDEYKKSTGITPGDVSRLRQWLSTQPHLPGEYITDMDLILAYHCCDRSAEVSKQVLDLHFTLRTLFTCFFQDRVLEDRQEKLARTIWTLMLLDLWQRESGTWPGLVMVIDLLGVTMSHVTKIELQPLQKFLYYMQEAMLLKLHGVHFVHAPSFMDKIMFLLKPFLKKPLLDMIFIHQRGVEELEKDGIPLDIFPKDLGGKFKTLKETEDDYISKLKDNRQFFILESNRRVDESKRPGRPKDISDIFQGVVGSFKTLDID